MNCRNGEKFLHRSITSVLRQNYKNIEHNIWDYYVQYSKKVDVLIAMFQGVTIVQKNILKECRVELLINHY